MLLLAAGVELDGAMRGLCARAQGDAGRPYATFGLALATLDDAHWSALTPAAPLRFWRLLEVDAADSLTAAPLRIDERILHYLAGVEHLAATLEGVAELVDETVPLVPSQATAAARIADYLASGPACSASRALRAGERARRARSPMPPPSRSASGSSQFAPTRSRCSPPTRRRSREPGIARRR